MQENSQVTWLKREFNKKLINKLIIAGVFFIISLIIFIISTIYITIAYNDNFSENYKLYQTLVANPELIGPNDYDSKDLIRLGPDMYTWKQISRFSTPGNGSWAYITFIISIIIMAPTMVFIVLFFLINFFPIDWDKRKEKKAQKNKVETETRRLTKVGN